MKYYFDFGVDGYVGVEVDSGDLRTAYKNAESVVDEMDFGQLSDAEYRLVTVYDEDHNEIDFSQPELDYGGTDFDFEEE